VPLGTLLVDVIRAILLALATVESSLALSLPLVLHMFVAPLLYYTSDGGIVNEGSTDSTMITPCRSLSVAIAGTVVVTSLISVVAAAQAKPSHSQATVSQPVSELSRAKPIH
jgi:hypothetical protein